MSADAEKLSLNDVERETDARSREVLRRLLQARMDQRGPGDVGPALIVTKGEGRARETRRHGQKRRHGRNVLTIFGALVLRRLAYHAAEAASIHPLDALGADETRAIVNLFARLPASWHDELGMRTMGSSSQSGRSVPPTPQTPSLAPGMTVGGYALERELGRGPHGVVFGAKKEGPGALVALKVFDDASRGPVIERLLEKFAALDLGGIAKLVDSGVAGDRPYYASELVDGTALDRYVASRKPPLRDRVKIVSEAASCLATAHAQGITHGDLKASNVLIATDGAVKLTDFAVTAIFDSARPLVLSATTSPEQVGGNPIDPRTDVYALGALLAEVIFGRPLFVASARLPLDKAIAEKKPLLPQGDAGLMRIIERAVEKNPADRHVSALDFARELKEWLASRPKVPASSPAFALHTSKSEASPSGVAPLVVAGLFVVIMAIAIFAYAQHKRSSGPRRAHGATSTAESVPEEQWTEFAPVDSFSVVLPEAAGQTTSFVEAKVTEPDGHASRTVQLAMPISIAELKSRGEFFAVAVVDFPEEVIQSQSRDAAFGLVAAGIARTWHTPPFESDHEAWNGLPAAAFATVDGNGAHVRGRLVLNGNRMIALVTASPKERSENVTRFLASLKLEGR